MEFKDVYLLVLLILFIPIPIGVIWFYCSVLRSNQNIIEPQNNNNNNNDVENDNIDVQNNNDDVVIHINENVQNDTI